MTPNSNNSNYPINTHVYILRPFNNYISSLDYMIGDVSKSRPMIVLKSDVSATFDSNSQYEVGTYQNQYIVQ